MSTKGAIIANAYNWIRIRGITVDPAAEDNELALELLESTAAEFQARNICLNYAFEETPDTGTPHNMPRMFWFPIECIIAYRLLMAFGKDIPPSLFNLVGAGETFLSCYSAMPRQTSYPARMPTGEANTLRRKSFDRYYGPTSIAPNECVTNKMYTDDIDNFVENFSSYLNTAEYISSFTIEADTGLTIVSSSATPAGAATQVNYQIQAVGNNGLPQDDNLQVKIVMTTDSGRVETRIINFQVIDTDIID